MESGTALHVGRVWLGIVVILLAFNVILAHPKCSPPPDKSGVDFGGEAASLMAGSRRTIKLSHNEFQPEPLSDVLPLIASHKVCVEKKSDSESCQQRLSEREKLSTLWTWASHQEGYESLLESRVKLEDAITSMEDGDQIEALTLLMEAIDLHMKPMTNAESQMRWQRGLRGRASAYAKSRIHLYRLLVLLADGLEGIAKVEGNSSLMLLGAAQWSLEVANTLAEFGGDDSQLQQRNHELVSEKIRREITEAVSSWSVADLRSLLERYHIPCGSECNQWLPVSKVVAEHATTLFGGFDEEIMVEDGHIDMSPDRLTAAKLNAWIGIDGSVDAVDGGIGGAQDYWTDAQRIRIETNESLVLNGTSALIDNAWMPLVVDLKPSQSKRAHILIMSSATQELAVRSQCSMCQHPKSGMWLNKHCIINRRGVVGSLGMDGVRAAAGASGGISHYIGTQLFERENSGEVGDGEHCRQVLEVSYGKQRAVREAGEKDGIIQISAVSKPIRGIPGMLTKSPSSKKRSSRYSLNPIDGNGIEFHCRSVSQGVIAVDLTFVPQATAEDFGPVAIYYAWEELPLPLSGIEYTRMLGILSGPATLEAERIWAPAQPLDERPLRTLCVSVQALSNKTIGYDMFGVPYYQNPYATVFDIVKGTDWERDTRETPAEATLRGLLAPSKDEYVDMIEMKQRSQEAGGGYSGIFVQDDEGGRASSSSAGGANGGGQEHRSAAPKDGGTSKTGHKQKRRESVDNRNVFERDQYLDTARDISDRILLQQGETRDRPLVPLLLITCIAACVGMWHWRPLAKVFQSIHKSDAPLSSSKRRSETSEAVALRAAMVDGVDSTKLANAINNAELHFESVDAAVIRRARTLLSERRRLEKVAEVQRKKAAARIRFNQEAAARIAVKKQEAQLAKEAKERTEKKLAAKDEHRHIGASTQYDVVEIAKPSAAEMSTDDEDDDVIDNTSDRAKADREEEELKLAIEKSLDLHKAEQAVRASMDRQEKISGAKANAVTATPTRGGRRKVDDERKVQVSRPSQDVRKKSESHTPISAVDGQSRTLHAKQMGLAGRQQHQQYDRKPGAAMNGRFVSPRQNVRTPQHQHQHQHQQHQQRRGYNADDRILPPKASHDPEARGPNREKRNAQERVAAGGVRESTENGKQHVWNRGSTLAENPRNPVAPAQAASSAPLNTNAPAYTRQAAPSSYMDLAQRQSSTVGNHGGRVLQNQAITSHAPPARQDAGAVPKYGAAGFVGQPLKVNSGDSFPQPADLPSPVQPGGGELTRLSSQSSSEIYDMRDARSGSTDSLLEGILNLLPDDITNDRGPVSSKDGVAQYALRDAAAAVNDGNGDAYSWSNHFNSIFSGGISSMWGAPDTAVDPVAGNRSGAASAPLGGIGGNPAATTMWSQNNGGSNTTTGGMNSASDFQFGGSTTNYFDNVNMSTYDGWNLRENNNNLSNQTGSTLYGMLSVEDADSETRGGAGSWSRSSSM